MRVIIDFFTDYNLSEVREIHQNIDRVCLTSDEPPFDDPEERDNLLSFRDSEEKVMEAALLLMESNSDASSSTRPHPKAETDGETIKTLDFADVQNKVFQLQNELSDLSKSLVKSFGKAVTLRFHSK